MFFDIAIVGLQALLVIAMAYLGVHVTLHPQKAPRSKRNFKIYLICFASLSVVLVCAQAVNSFKAQATLQNRLNEIEKNTKVPPKVEVTNTVPPAQVIIQPPQQGSPATDARTDIYPEHLREDQKRRMQEFLRRRPAAAIVISTLKDRPKRLSFADDLLTVFRSSGWTAPPNVLQLNGENAEALRHAGILILDFNGQEDRRLFPSVSLALEALQAGNVPHVRMPAQWGMPLGMEIGPVGENETPFKAVWIYLGRQTELP